MRQGSVSNPVGVSVGGEPEPGQGPEASRRLPGRGTGTPQGRRWLSEPKAVIWLALAAAVLLGGGRRLIAWWQARKAVARLDAPDVTAAEIEAVADHGRTGAYDLLRIFSSGPSEQVRQAAGSSLARLWLLDQLVPEEEQAVVRRGFTVTWMPAAATLVRSKPRFRSPWPTKCRFSMTAAVASTPKTWNGGIACWVHAA